MDTYRIASFFFYHITPEKKKKKRWRETGREVVFIGLDRADYNAHDTYHIISLRFLVPKSYDGAARFSVPFSVPRGEDKREVSREHIRPRGM